jgi:hypothetical protein
MTKGLSKVDGSVKLSSAPSPSALAEIQTQGEVMPSLSHTSIGSSNHNVTYLSDDDPWVDDYLAIQHSRARFIVRAYLAYLRYSPFDPDDDSRFSELPSETFSNLGFDEETERNYVCLGGPTGKLLAVYRIDSRKKLKRLRRYPVFILEMFADQIPKPLQH